MAVNSHALNTTALNGKGRSRFVYFFADSNFSLSSEGRISVRTSGEGQGTFGISQSAVGTREVRPLAASNVGVSAFNDSLLHTHGFRGSGWFGFESRQAEYEVLVSSGQQDAEFSFNTLSATPLDEVFVLRLTILSSSESTRRVYFKAFSGLDVAVNDVVEGIVTRQMSALDNVGFVSVAEPAINGIHESTAFSAIDFFATSDEVLVRSNSLGDASVKINCDLDVAKVNMRHAGRATGLVGLASESETFVNSMMRASSVFSINNVSASWFRTRLFKASNTFGFGITQQTSRVTRRFFASDSFSINSISSVAVRVIFARTDSIIQIKQMTKATRIQRANGVTSFGLTSDRARALSNLTQPAAECNTFVVPEREYEFVLPAEEREFTVWC